MGELAVRARRLAAQGALRAVLDELEDGDPYERRIAVIAAAVGRDAEWIGARLADEDAVVRGHALRAARTLGVPDPAYERAFADAPAAVRRPLVRAIVVDRRTALADRLVITARDTYGDIEAARLLPGCSATTVAALLPELRRSTDCWSSLGHHHPGPLLDSAEEELAGLPATARDAWWQDDGHTRGIAATLHAHPDRVLDLLERFGPTRLPAALHRPFGRLVAADPVRVARLAIRPDVCTQLHRALSGTQLRRLVRALPDPLLVELGRSAPDQLPAFLCALPPARRAALHEAVTDGRGEGASGTTVDTGLLDALPRNRVAPVARRLAERARDRGADAAVLLAMSYLPFDEGREPLLAATRGPDADERATAWSLLVGSAGRSGDPAVVAAVLEDLLRLRNEQDPVRSAALTSLAGVKPALFTDAVEPLLDRVAADAVEARDSSPATRSALGRLAVGALREHAVTGQRDLLNWALRTLVRITGSSGSADFGRLDRTLRRGQEHTVFEALRPWLEAGAERSDYGLVLALARAVGRRADAMPGLQELLWQAVNYGEPSAARSAATLWLRAPAGRDERVERLLARHPSALALPEVRRVVTYRRTDLLESCLDGTPPRGRFLAPGTPWTVEVAGPERWTPGQQHVARIAVEGTVADEKLPLHLRTTALGRLARIPGRGADAVRPWTDDEDVVIAEAALAALPHTDRPADALPDLLAHAGDDRARVAMYAAGRAAAYARPSRLVPLLAARTAPGTGKVTSRKEVVRLAAELLPRAEAAALLADAYGQPDQHVDVRAACVTAGTPLLGDVRMWEVAEHAAGGERALRAAVLQGPPDGAGPGPAAALRPADPGPVPHRRRRPGRRRPHRACPLAAVGPARGGGPGRGDHRSGPAGTVALGRRRPRGRRPDRPGHEPGPDPRPVPAVHGRDGGRRGGGAGPAGPPPDRPSAPGRCRCAPGRTTDRWRRCSPRPAGPWPPSATSCRTPSPCSRAPWTWRRTRTRCTPNSSRSPPCTAAARRSPPGLRRPSAGEVVGYRERRSAIRRPCCSSSHGWRRRGIPPRDCSPPELTVACGLRTGWTGPWRTQLRMLRQHPCDDVRDVAYAEATAEE